MSEKIDELLKTRNEEYGASWLSANNAIYVMCEGDASRLQKLLESGHLANWVIIISKICRAIQTPEKTDHWKDISGYSNLSLALEESRGMDYGVEEFSIQVVNAMIEFMSKSLFAKEDER